MDELSQIIERVERPGWKVWVSRDKALEELAAYKAATPEQAGQLWQLAQSTDAGTAAAARRAFAQAPQPAVAWLISQLGTPERPAALAALLQIGLPHAAPAIEPLFELAVRPYRDPNLSEAEDVERALEKLGALDRLRPVLEEIVVNVKKMPDVSAEEEFKNRKQRSRAARRLKPFPGKDGAQAIAALEWAAADCDDWNLGNCGWLFEFLAEAGLPNVDALGVVLQALTYPHTQTGLHWGVAQRMADIDVVLPGIARLGPEGREALEQWAGTDDRLTRELVIAALKKLDARAACTHDWQPQTEIHWRAPGPPAAQVCTRCNYIHVVAHQAPPRQGFGE